MAKEIERKFLVDKKLWKQAKRHVHDSEILVQGYLSKKPTVRVRVSSNNYAVLTIKGKTKGFTCDEFEYKIPVADAKQLLKTCSEVVKKTRHWIQPIDEHLWSIDEFAGLNKGLLLAEIELSSEKEDFMLPYWVDKDVTLDKRYKNTYLSTHKVPTK